MTDPGKWLHDRGISLSVAREAGVQYDSVKDAMLYPRMNAEGVRIGWKIRGLSSGGQYNYPSGIPLKDTMPFLAQEGSGCLCICEGETDALMLATVSHLITEIEDAHIIGIPGATTFNNEWAGMYSKYDSVFVFPDPDDAGKQMTDKICGLIARAKVIVLKPEYGDLSDSLHHDFGYVVDAIQEAQPVPVKKVLRRTGYKFQQTHNIPVYKLADEVAKDTTLRARGKEFVGLCPLHKEDSPSFMVDPKKGLFYCHGCQQGGDIISYLKSKRKIGYSEARAIAESL